MNYSMKTGHGNVAMVVLLWCKFIPLTESALGSVSSKWVKCVPVCRLTRRPWPLIVCVFCHWFKTKPKTLKRYCIICYLWMT